MQARMTMTMTMILVRPDIHTHTHAYTLAHSFALTHSHISMYTHTLAFTYLFTHTHTTHTQRKGSLPAQSWGSCASRSSAWSCVVRVCVCVWSYICELHDGSTALHKPLHHFTTLHHYTTLHCTTLHNISRHYTTLHYAFPHYTGLMGSFVSYHIMLICKGQTTKERIVSQRQAKTQSQASADVQQHTGESVCVCERERVCESVSMWMSV
jgi:hypothetical protein